MPKRLLVTAADHMPAGEVDEVARRFLDHFRLQTIFLGPSSLWPLHGTDALMEIDDNVSESCALCSRVQHCMTHTSIGEVCVSAVLPPRTQLAFPHNAAAGRIRIPRGDQLFDLHVHSTKHMKGQILFVHEVR